jgi:hypothetical protein
MAWVGTWPDPPQDSFRVEAAAFEGRPVFFRITGPWSRAVHEAPPIPADFTFPVILFFVIILPIGAGFLARRNIRLGRGDRRGSFRLASFAFVCVFLRNISWQHHIPAVAEAGLLFFALRDALTIGVLYWLLYMAFEPWVRRRSPSTLISWSRLLAGRFRDPLVGADLLVGLLLGVLALCLVRPLLSPYVAMFAPQLMPTAGGWFGLWCWSAGVGGVGSALTWLFFLTLVRILFPWRLVAAVLVFIVIGSFIVAMPGATLSGIALCCITAFSLIRFGLLSTAAMLSAYSTGAAFPTPLKPSAWYFEAALVASGSIVVLALYAFHTTLAGRPLWKVGLHGT